MSEHCPQDGGFVGDAGCTHPHHEHSELVKRVISGNPDFISPEEFDTAVKEGFIVEGVNRKKFGFGKALDRHFNIDHDPQSEDIKRRKERLAFAVATVMRPERTLTNHKNLPGRTAYAKSFNGFGMLVIADSSNNVEQVFNYVPNRKGKKKG